MTRIVILILSLALLVAAASSPGCLEKPVSGKLKCERPVERSDLWAPGGEGERAAIRWANKKLGKETKK